MNTCRMLLALISVCATVAIAAEKPNIVVIYTDDVGFADVGCYGAKGVATPNVDRIAKEGLRFTDAHCSAATCTPSRFALLTGSYAFRQKGTGVLSGNAGMIIKPGVPTLPSLLKEAGYATGVVGKWHLGLGDGNANWNEAVKPGPNEIGFDYHFLIPATGDRVPCVYLEQNRVVDLDPADPIETSYGKPIGDGPFGTDIPDQLKQKWSHGHNSTIVNGISRIGFMTGGEKARWVDEDMADVISHKAVSFIEQHQEKPFFLYFSTHDIHVPRVPHSRFVGKSTMGLRGDAIVQMDWCVGEVLNTLDRLKLTDNTLVIFSSDNGPVLDDGYVDMANEKLGDHDPAGGLRGGKYSVFEGGTRVPFIVRWPGHVDAASESDALFGQVDLAASLASLVGVSRPEKALPDSQNELDTLLGEDSVGRPHLVHEAKSLALRVGKWKYIAPATSRDKLGPWNNVKVEKPGALYDLSRDRGELHDVGGANADKLAEMAKLLAALQDQNDR
ncbi:MAG: arylsulfatase [Planctomycetaceae bacterium]|nr:arylsulfatase [Planctomycetales bacterium]MCB9937597.1 arylsulfatase [Planctomycetaceae bacterium]